ncbi:restriction endonuclease subunit S [Enterococcus hirae]|nr:restriction endonuclease subunit S [Enterococcus hirae]
MTEKKTPEIRFKGFTDDWEQRKLGSKLSLLKDGTHGTHIDCEEGPYLLSAKNIKNGIVNITTSERKISFEEFEKIHSKFKLEKDDILLTIVGSIGEAAILKNNEHITFQRSVAYLRPKSMDTHFLYTLITGPEFQKELKNRQVVSAQPGIYLGDLDKIPVSFPNDIAEQYQIGQFFKQLDDAITLHQRKLELLQQTKKGFLQKIFPQQGEIQPQFRFKEFSEPWEQRKFDEAFDFPVSNNSLSRAQLNYETGEIKSVHYGDILVNYDSVLEVGKARIPFITDGTLKKYESNLLKNGDIILADAAEDETVGKAVEVSGISDDFIVAGLHTIIARPKKEMAKYFAGYYINSDIFHRQLLRLIQGTKISSISKSNLGKTMVSYPKKIEEQEQIGTFFKQLDTTIVLYQNKIEMLKQIKTAYLNDMFI